MAQMHNPDLGTITNALSTDLHPSKSSAMLLSVLHHCSPPRTAVLIQRHYVQLWIFIAAILLFIYHTCTIVGIYVVIVTF